MTKPVKAKAAAKKVNLTPAQLAMLDRVCRSNGGGVHAGFSESGRDTKVLRRLEALGFVQGKSGRASVAVHTRDGLKYWKENFRVEIREVK